jgi:hypothetical protein
MASVTVINAISDTTAITVQTMTATATSHTTGPTTPIPELSATRQGLTSGWLGRYVWWSLLANCDSLPHPFFPFVPSSGW